MMVPNDIVCEPNLLLHEALYVQHLAPGERVEAKHIWRLSLNNRPFPHAPEAFIGLEFSLVPEVEAVLVEIEAKRRLVRVVSVVNQRDPEIRARIYGREQAVIDAFPNFDFSFRIISRMDRSPSEIMDQVGKLVYRR